MADSVSISVLICAWNRAQGVERILSELARQTLSPSEFEVIIVDNNSTDNTPEVVAHMATDAPYSIRYIHEPRQGKCWALNTGLEAARGDIIVCLDDDCVPARDWLQAVVEAFRDEPVSLLGGPCLSEFSEAVARDSYRKFLGDRFLGSFEPYAEFTEIFDKNPPMGMNLAFRKVVAQRVGGFDVNLGPRPGRHIGREETAFIRQAQASGFRVFYSPAMVVHHYIDDRRISWASIRKQGYYSGIGSGREKCHPDGSMSIFSKLLLSTMFVMEAFYSILRVVLYAASWRKRTVTKFRLTAACGKLVGLWSRN